MLRTNPTANDQQRGKLMKSLWHVTLASAALVLPSLAATAQTEWMSRVGDALGKTGSEMPGGVYRVGLPRTDLKVTLDGVELKAGLRSARGSHSRRWATTRWSWATSSLPGGGQSGDEEA